MQWNDSTMFIADKLRGIPLVSRPGERNQSAITDNNTRQVPPVPVSVRQLVVVEKREAESRLARQTTSDEQILFKPSAMTASTANIMRKKPTTSTTTPKPTTTRRPRVQSKPPIKRPAAQPHLAKMIKQAAGDGDFKVRSIAGKELNIGTTTSTTTTTTEPSTTSVVAEFAKPLESQTRQAMLNLSRVDQVQRTMTTEPGYQRRTSQAVQPPRFTNRANERGGNQFAGENWVLFNRPDGGLSLFELMVLVSNIMIVSTIVLVILFNWIKSLKRKRPAATAGQQQTAPERPPGTPTRSPDSTAGERAAGKMSTISSGLAAGTGEDSLGNGLAQGASKQMTGANEQPTGSISTELKQGATNVANKAMAIVQPTENPSQNSVASSDKLQELKSVGLLDQPSRPINRSASDLSASSSPKKQQARTGNGLSKMPINEMERIKAMENLLSNSTASLPTATDLGAASPSKAERILSASSLDSIELPETLVSSIKGASGNKELVMEAPSPNLLLGDSLPAKSEQKLAAPEQTPGPNPKPAEQLAEPKESKEKPRKAEPGGKKQVAGNKKQTSNKPMEQQDEINRPQNPMGRDNMVAPSEPAGEAAELKNHQVVVNKLDKRKTNLELVDIRDESVTGKMRGSGKEPEGAGWISMDGVAVVQGALPSTGTGQSSPKARQSPGPASQPLMSPSEIIESRFHVDYKSSKSNKQLNQSVDSKGEENIEEELEADNKMRNRKYFVYVVHDGHFTAKKECIARIELPPKRRITLAELRQLIANSQDISLSGLRRNRFKFVTETYRLLNENEDAAVLHQVYPTQGVFLKLNIPEQEGQVHHVYQKGRARLSSGGAPGSSLAQTTIASRRRANVRPAEQTSNVDQLPSIEIDYSDVANYGRSRAASVGRRGPGAAQMKQRSKSSMQARPTARRPQVAARNEEPPPILDLDSLSDRRRSFTGTPLAEMSDHRMRIITPSQYCSRASCGRLATIRCGLCNHAHYCSVQCRFRDWSQHKQFCKKPRWKVSA